MCVRGAVIKGIPDVPTVSVLADCVFVCPSVHVCVYQSETSLFALLSVCLRVYQSAGCICCVCVSLLECLMFAFLCVC